MGLLSIGALLIVLLVELYAKANRLWTRGLWPVLGVSIVLLGVSATAYYNARTRLVDAMPESGAEYLRAKDLLPAAQDLCPNPPFNSIGDCLESNPGTITPEHLYGGEAIEDAEGTLLFRYLAFGFFLFFTLTTVLEALVWHNKGTETKLRTKPPAKPKPKKGSSAQAGGPDGRVG